MRKILFLGLSLALLASPVRADWLGPSAVGNQPVQKLLLFGTTGSIGGSSLTAGACASGTVMIAGATLTSKIDVSPQTYPGAGFWWSGYLSSASTNTITVTVCAAVAGTPAASLYNVGVTP